MTPDEVPADLVDKACRARWDALDSVFTGHFGDVARTWDALTALFPTEADRRRSNERHTLAAVLPEIQAQALRDASNDILKSLSTGGVGSPANWLHHRAARLTTTTQEPTT